MTPTEILGSPTTADDLESALAFALRFEGRKRVHNADEIMTAIVAKRLAAHLERAGFAVMKKPADVALQSWEEAFRGSDLGPQTTERRTSAAQIVLGQVHPKRKARPERPLQNLGGAIRR